MGVAVGDAVGAAVGDAVGAAVGDAVGAAVGVAVGALVGVGAAVGVAPPHAAATIANTRLATAKVLLPMSSSVCAADASSGPARERPCTGRLPSSGPAGE